MKKLHDSKGRVNKKAEPIIDHVDTEIRSAIRDLKDLGFDLRDIAYDIILSVTAEISMREVKTWLDECCKKNPKKEAV